MPDLLHSYFSSNNALLAYFVAQYGLTKDQGSNTSTFTRIIDDNELLVSVRKDYLPDKTKSWGYGKPYEKAYREYNSWIEKYHPELSSNFSPCTGETKEECGKWVTFDLANAFIVHISLDSNQGGQECKGNSCLHYISALNFVMTRQHRIAEHVLGNLCPQLKVMTHMTGI